MALYSHLNRPLPAKPTHCVACGKELPDNRPYKYQYVDTCEGSCQIHKWEQDTLSSPTQHAPQPSAAPHRKQRKRK